MSKTISPFTLTIFLAFSTCQTIVLWCFIRFAVLSIYCIFFVYSLVNWSVNLFFKEHDKSKCDLMIYKVFTFAIFPGKLSNVTSPRLCSLHTHTHTHALYLFDKCHICDLIRPCLSLRTLLCLVIAGL